MVSGMVLVSHSMGSIMTLTFLNRQSQVNGEFDGSGQPQHGFHHNPQLPQWAEPNMVSGMVLVTHIMVSIMTLTLINGQNQVNGERDGYGHTQHGCYHDPHLPQRAEPGKW